MTALSYLYLTRIKNSVKNLIRRPARLIYAVFIIALLVFTFVMPHSEIVELAEFRDKNELYAILNAFYGFMFLLIAKNGFSNGGSIFAMPDVNLIFPAPIPQRRVLFYGLIRQVGVSLLMSFFVLFQYNWMYQTYGISYGFLLLIILGYALSVFFGQFIAMIIYSLTAADERKKRTAKTLYFVYILALLSYIGITTLKSQPLSVQALVETLGSPVIGYTPFSGWLGMITSGVAKGDTATVIIGAGLCLALCTALLIIFERINSDYYEDVIKTAEVSQSAINASRQGVMTEKVSANVKVGKTGFDRGEGANMFYHKHMLENRRARVFILDTMTLVWVACVVATSLFMKNIGIIPIFAVATYIQLFSVALGRFNKELLKPYIYLIPEPPLKKMLYALRESLPTAVVEALLMFIPVFFIIEMTVLQLILCILARLTFTAIYITGNVIVTRIWSGSVSKVAVMLLYLFVMLILMAPGIALAIFTAAMNFVIIDATVTMFLMLSVPNALTALLGLYICRNMLQYAEYNYQ